ncbi:cytochrome P450 4C1 [Anabrus simplex]|uniref:cytochrome P450 4C1 n=1 Tax=Anabrus simplex TaxID=316456 RepID=UPI0035A31991
MEKIREVLNVDKTRDMIMEQMRESKELRTLSESELKDIKQSLLQEKKAEMKNKWTVNQLREIEQRPDVSATRKVRDMDNEQGTNESPAAETETAEQQQPQQVLLIKANGGHDDPVTKHYQDKVTSVQAMKALGGVEGRKYKQVEKLLYGLSDTVILNKLRELRENKQSEQDDEQMSKRAFLDILINSSESEGANLSNKQLRDEVITMLLAGIESTATSMCFALMLLACHPEIQEDVYQELKEVFADDWERPVTPLDAKELQLLNRVFKETIRLFPSIFFTGRQTTRELKLSTCTVPEGCMVFIPLYFVHRDPRFFPDPERFDPDRFLPERSQERHPYSYVPFGAGQRMCVGYKYAEMEMAVTLATVLRKYRFLPAVPYECLQKLEIPVITRPSCGFKVKMLPRA